MKKLFIIIILFFSMGINVNAQEEITADDIYSASGADNLSTGEILESYGVSFDEPSSILSIKPADLWKMIKEIVSEKIEMPIKLFISLGVIIILTALAETMGDTLKKGSESKLFELICVLSGVACISPSVCSAIESTALALSDGAEFMNCFVPVFSGIAAAGGHITSATGYNILVLMVSDISIQIAAQILMPMLGMCMCLAIVDASCDAISLKGFLNGVRKLVIWGLGLIMTVFTGLLSIQSIVGTSADSLTSKTAKYVISNCVPVIGGAVSDAYSTVKGSIILLRNGVGGVGILVLAVMLIPPILSLALHKLAVSSAAAAAEIFGAKKLSSLFENISSVLATAMGVLICFSLMFIVSTAIIMGVCSNNT